MRWLLMILLTLTAHAELDELKQRAQDYTTTVQLLGESRFKELDALAVSLKGQKYPSGRSRSHQFYLALRGALQPVQLQAWLEVNEDSVPARVLSGKPEEKLKDPFLTYLKLEKPLPPKERDELLAQEKTYLEAYQAAARTLKGKVLAEFADRATALYPKLNEGMYALVYSSFADRFGQAEFRNEETVFDRDRIINGYRELLKQFPDNRYYLSLYTKAAAGWEDKPRAADLGPRLAGFRDPDVWTQRQWDGFQKWLQGYQP